MTAQPTTKPTTKMKTYLKDSLICINQVLQAENGKKVATNGSKLMKKGIRWPPLSVGDCLKSFLTIFPSMVTLPLLADRRSALRSQQLVASQ
jgi:hypothetical protein